MNGSQCKHRNLRKVGPFLGLLLSISVFGCGGSSGGSPAPSSPAPFDTAKGEGNLSSHQLIVTYPTETSGAQTALNTSYNQTICPSALTTAECTTNQNSLDTPAFGNFNVASDPIGKNPLGIESIDAVKIDYTAINVDQSAVQVSGGVLIPQVAPTSLKGIILYFHGTTVTRSNVPSNFLTTANPVSAGANTDSVLLAAVWASQGYIVVMPDYIGLGDDTAGVHPYSTYPMQNAQSGLAMLKAARTMLAENFAIEGQLPLFLTGYSEGGAYALEAEHLMQDNSRYASVLTVKLKEAAPLSGFYDLSGTGLPYLFDNVSTTNNNWFLLDPAVSAASKPYLMADVGLSFANYSGVAPTDIFASAFYNCGGGLPCGTTNNLDGLYYTQMQVPGYDSFVAVIAIDQAQMTAWMIDNNAITSLLTSTYATELMNQDQSNPLYAQLAAADTYLFVPKIPIVLVSLMEDSVVTRKNSDVAFAYFTQQNPSGPYDEDLVDNNDFVASSLSVGPVDHTTELPFLSVLVLNQFNTAP